jgi:hypothetical protein
VPQPDTIAFLGINYCLQIKETGFAEWFYASLRMGPAQITQIMSLKKCEYRIIV